MLKSLTSILKWFTNLSDVKRVIAFMGAAVLFLGFFFIKRDKDNQKAYNELKLEYKKRLDTCETKYSKSIDDVIFWKDSLANEKLKNALLEIDKMKEIVNQVKKTEKQVISTSQNIKKNQAAILNKLKDEE